MKDKLKLKTGQEVTISIPFTYTIGEEGFSSNKILLTIEDCKNEVIEEIESGNFNPYDVYMEYLPNN